MADADRRLAEVVALLREGLASGAPLPDLAVLSAKAETALRVAEGTHPLLPTGVVQCGPEVPHPVGCACRWCSPPRAPR